MTTHKIWGLDLGTTSVGWAVLENAVPIAAGSRIFPEGMDRTRGEKSLNQDRQQARSIRRQTYRRVRRKQKVEHILVDMGLLPDSAEQRDLIFTSNNPYEMRALALEQKLQPYQLGRALYHLSQRRGYLSNRKTGEEKDGAVSTGISELQQNIANANCKTLGQYFYQVLKKEDKIRGCYTHRQMLVDEFNAIWDAQKVHHSQLNQRSYQRLLDGIFFQRPLKMQKHLIGFCELEPERRRAYAATLQAQDFRLWQTINNLNLQLQVGGVQTLTLEQKQQLFAFLATNKTRSWGAIKTHLGLLQGDCFNLEKHRPSGLLGNGTAAIVSKEVTVKVWNSWSREQQQQLVFDLLNIESEPALIKRLVNYWGLSEEKAKSLCDQSLKFAKGMMAYSHKAIGKLLPELAKGLHLDKALIAVGYQAKDDTKIQHNLLPLFDKDLRNPLVQRALFQVRRVVNALIKKHGMPDIIRVEMVRDLKNNAKRRADIEKQQRLLEAANKEAERFFDEHIQLGIVNPTRQDKLKYRLWRECEQQCPFTGKAINAHQAFVTGEVDVEHIIPYSRCLDDSFMNKTLCFKQANQLKGNRTPAEAFSGQEYQNMLQRVKKFNYKKRQRFNQDTSKFTSDFVSAQLNETGYIARETVNYLKLLGCKVETVKGAATAKLRHAWGLNSILNSENTKSRDDHRHHAVDAIVVALTDRKAVKKISDFSRRSNSGRFKLVDYPLPCADFRNNVLRAVERINVSFKTSHKVKGALHDETLYGVGERDEQNNPKTVVIRKPLVQLKDKDLLNIRDQAVRKKAQLHLAKYGSMKKAFVECADEFGFIATQGKFTPIKSVRLEYPLKVEAIGTGNRQRHIKTGSNHHVEIFQTSNAKGQPKWVGEVVSTLHATYRIRDKQPLIRTQNQAGNPLVMALHINDMLMVELNGKSTLCRVQKMSQKATGQVVITLRHHTNATTDKEGEISIGPEWLNKANARQVYVDVMGTIKGLNNDQANS